jgi:threonine/homoserine/homoserine lactone efflux protein
MIEAIVSGFLLGMAIVFSMGPVVFTIIKLRVNFSISHAFYFVAGVWLSDLILVLIANFFGNFLQGLIQYKLTIGICGGIFLIGLGLYNLIFRRTKSEQAEEDDVVITKRTTHAKLLAMGFLINTLNPSVIALWIAASTNAISKPLDARIALFIVCLLVNIIADIAKIYLAGKLRKKLTLHNIRIINIISGLLFMVFGAALIIEVLWHS